MNTTGIMNTTATPKLPPLPDFVPRPVNNPFSTLNAIMLYITLGVLTLLTILKAVSVALKRNKAVKAAQYVDQAQSVLDIVVHTLQNTQHNPGTEYVSHV